MICDVNLGCYIVTLMWGFTYLIREKIKREKENGAIWYYHYCLFSPESLLPVGKPSISDKTGTKAVSNWE